MQPKGKKAQAFNIGIIVTLIVTVGVAVMALIFIGTLGGATFTLIEPDIDEIGNNIIANESFTSSNSTKALLAHGFVQSGTLYIVNSTTAADSVAIGIANFTIDYDEGSLVLKSGMPVAYNGSTFYASYKWGAAEIRASVRNGITNSFEALEQTGDYLPIIVLAVVIFIVLGLVLGFMGNKQMGGGGAL